MTRLRQRGFNLVEVLVAMAVLAIGLMGLAGMQTRGVQFNQQSYSRTQAAQIADDYAERMYANRAGIQKGYYSAYFGDSTKSFDSNLLTDCAASLTPTALSPDNVLKTCARQPNKSTPDVCDAAQLAFYDQYVIACGVPVTVSGTTTRYGGVKDLLRNGRIVASCAETAPTTCASPGRATRITVTWTERGTNGTVSTGGSADVTNATLSVVVRP